MRPDILPAGRTAEHAVLPGHRVSRLRLHQFRNYVEQTVHLGPGMNVISGPNAQGKTNLLEAIATLLLTRSPRASSTGDLLRWGSASALVDADVNGPRPPARLSVRFDRQPPANRVRRVTSVEGNPRPARDILGICPVVLFWPDDLQLVKAGPEGRRRLLDVVLSQLDVRIAVDLLRYRRTLEQRNALLRQLRSGAGHAGTLAGFNHELASRGARIQVARAGLVAGLGIHARAALDQITGSGEQLELKYVPDGSAAVPGSTVSDVEASLAGDIDRRVAEEITRGVSLVGPHRDDVEILLDSRPARSTASQGQQRSIVLAWKVAEVRHLSEVCCAAPVLLLDDVLSELDHERRGQLLGLLSHRAELQVMVTTIEQDILSGFQRSDAVRFTVRGGQVLEGGWARGSSR